MPATWLLKLTFFTSRLAPGLAALTGPVFSCAKGSAAAVKLPLVPAAVLLKRKTSEWSAQGYSPFSPSFPPSLDALSPGLVVLQALHLGCQILWQLPGHLIALRVPVVVAAGVFIPHLLPVTHLQFSHCQGTRTSRSLIGPAPLHCV